ncbi:MAG: hypothetical protein K9H58_17985 [Bacteroidales bacterium]|nr:hypothetical protein [Bacteroidales bacterium]
MKSFLIFIFLSLTIRFLLAQETSWTYPLKMNFATNFEFIKNENKEALLFIDYRDSYHIFLLDSNYRILKEFRDRFYSSSDPKLVGSISTNDHIELFFRQFKSNVLMVLDLDLKAKTLKIIKDYKITDSFKEEIVYTGSNISGNKMITVSKKERGLVYTDHLGNSEMKKTFIPLKEEDKQFIDNSTWYQFESANDTMSIMYMSTWESGLINKFNYKLFEFDLVNPGYKVTDFEESKEISFRPFFMDSLIIENKSGKTFLLRERHNGKYLGEFMVHVDSIVSNENIQLLKYSFDCNLKTLSQRYKFLNGNKRNIIKHYYPDEISFVRDSAGLYLELVYKNVKEAFEACEYKVVCYLHFDWEKKRVMYQGPYKNPDADESVKYHIQKKIDLNLKTSGYVLGFNHEVLLGYLLKKPKTFVLEKADFK